MNYLRVAIYVLFFLIPFCLRAETFEISFFFQHGCDDCRYVKEVVLPKTAESYEFTLKEYDTANRDNFKKLLAILNRFNDDTNESVYIVVNDQFLLSGRNMIEDKLTEILKTQKNSSDIPSEIIENNVDSSDIERKIYDNFSISAIIIAGLIDGINPCVFFTLVYLISILAVSHATGKNIFTIGVVYCLTCFVSYFLIGLFALRAIFALYNIHYLKEIIKIGTISILSIFSILSFWDAILYYKNRNANKIILKLPEKITSKIHAIIKSRLKFKLFLGGIVFVSFLVTMIELPCTGQIYLPTLVLISQQDMSANSFALLFLYNLMFIIPLLIVFGIAASGVSVINFLQAGKRHMAMTKIILGLLFLGIAVLTIYI